MFKKWDRNLQSKPILRFLFLLEIQIPRKGSLTRVWDGILQATATKSPYSIGFYRQTTNTIHVHFGCISVYRIWTFVRTLLTNVPKRQGAPYQPLISRKLGSCVVVLHISTCNGSLVGDVSYHLPSEAMVQDESLNQLHGPWGRVGFSGSMGYSGPVTCEQLHFLAWIKENVVPFILYLQRFKQTNG